MKFPRRQFLQLATAAAALPTVARIPKAQTYPTRAMRVMVGFETGQAIDIVTRILAQ